MYLDVLNKVKQVSIFSDFLPITYHLIKFDFSCCTVSAVIYRN